jgi:hypothetical protein
MRRFGWLQIAGLLVACGVIAGLAVLAFARGASPPRPVSPRPTASARATATPDPRVAEVEAAARRYVQALQDSAKTGDPAPVDALVVPGSQAAGLAGIAASFSRTEKYNFIVDRVDFDAASWIAQVNTTTATVSFRYSLHGHDADWPSLRPRETDHESQPLSASYQFELHEGSWLIAHID